MRKSFCIISQELTDINALQQLLVDLNFTSTALFLFNTAENTTLVSFDGTQLNTLAEYEQITNITEFNLGQNLNITTDNFSVLLGNQVEISVSILQQLGVTLETLNSVVIESAEQTEMVDGQLLIFQETFETTQEIQQQLNILVGNNSVLELEFDQNRVMGQN